MLVWIFNDLASMSYKLCYKHMFLTYSIYFRFFVIFPHSFEECRWFYIVSSKSFVYSWVLIKFENTVLKWPTFPFHFWFSSLLQPPSLGRSFLFSSFQRFCSMSDVLFNFCAFKIIHYFLKVYLCELWVPIKCKYSIWVKKL